MKKPRFETWIIGGAGMLLLFTSLAAQTKKIEEEDDDVRGRAAISVSVDQVRVDVAVRNKKGNLITGLKKEHFELYVDKVRQEITNFAPLEAPLTAVLVIEYSKVLPWELLYESWLSSHYFVQGMRKDDWVAVVAYDIRPEILVDFTQDQGEVLKSLRRLNFPAFRESNVYDALYDVLDRLQETEGKTAIILVSSGLDTFSKKNLSQMLKRVKSANSSIYVVSLGGQFRARSDHRFSSDTRMDFLQADNFLKTITKWTGGEAFFPRFTSQYPQIFQSIGAMLRSQYSLSFSPTNKAKDGKFHKIQIKVKIDLDGDGKPDKLKLNHRQGYMARKS